MKVEDLGNWPKMHMSQADTSMTMIMFEFKRIYGIMNISLKMLGIFKFGKNVNMQQEFIMNLQHCV